MCVPSQAIEQKVLILSSVFALMFAVGGLAVGLILGSLVIAFDGLYSLISLLLTILSLLAAKLIHSPKDKRFPNGKAMFEPIVIAIKGVVIMSLVIYSLFGAIDSLIQGVKPLDIGVASVFGLINTLGCGFAWWKITQMSRESHSGLIEAETKQWQMDTLLSMAITLGFVIAWGLTQTSLAQYAGYADPLMMILISAYFLKVPFSMVSQAVKELLQMAPQQELIAEVSKGMKEVDSQETLHLGSVVKVGNELRIDINVVPSEESIIKTGDIKVFQQNLKQKLSALPYKLELKMNIAI
ncbi:cation diffusion facilitator family transporter [Shewanella sp. 5_MG-2023]|uniref:cation diffusion facilitator family transporter n=1 Tax=Shewanella sp. 5_MG-2023 TaxID=3062656 RepID=UPI0026E1C308|nr:cation diffusion facilitator family transporter [Shewanella sp. 5_MG-2023]MDO6638642.1 cation diffusion facilitator family transporter [Shewanella sp. 5_MG-2023]